MSTYLNFARCLRRPFGFGYKTITPQGLLPDADELSGSQRAVYEYLGLAWARIRGKI